MTKDLQAESQGILVTLFLARYEALGMANQNILRRGEQRIFCYLTVLLGEGAHNSGRRGEQQTVHISSSLQHAPGPD